MPSRRWTEERVDRAIGNMLRAGVFLAVAIVAVGATILLARHGAERPDYRVFKEGPGDLRSVGGTVARALGGGGRGIIQLGLLVLIATPVSRVAFSVAAFAAQGDKKFVGITLLVLATLLYGLFGGIA